MSNVSVRPSAGFLACPERPEVANRKRDRHGEQVLTKGTFEIVKKYEQARAQKELGEKHAVAVSKLKAEHSEELKAIDAEMAALKAQLLAGEARLGVEQHKRASAEQTVQSLAKFDNSCVICMEHLHTAQIVELPCGHCLHVECFQTAADLMSEEMARIIRHGGRFTAFDRARCFHCRASLLNISRKTLPHIVAKNLDLLVSLVRKCVANNMLRVKAEVQRVFPNPVNQPRVNRNMTASAIEVLLEAQPQLQIDFSVCNLCKKPFCEDKPDNCADAHGDAHRDDPICDDCSTVRARVVVDGRGEGTFMQLHLLQYVEHLLPPSGALELAHDRLLVQELVKLRRRRSRSLRRRRRRRSRGARGGRAVN